MHTQVQVPASENRKHGTSFVVRRHGHWKIDWSEKRTNWIGNSAILDAVQELATRCAGGLLIDVGAGNMPYRGVLEEQGCRYESLDWPDSFHVRGGKHTYYSEANQIPVPDGRFDAVLCTEVLEHLSDPHATLAEFHRVLKPGGTLLLTVPFVHGEHEAPHDHFRFTRYCLARMFEEAGFRIESIDSRTELIGSILILHNCFWNLLWKRASRKLRMRWLNSVFNPLIFLLMIMPQLVYRLVFRQKPSGSWRDRWWELTEPWTSGFIVWATRPGPTEDVSGSPKTL